jgi:hypothetical protein
MQIPKDIESRITWTRRKDEAWNRVDCIQPVGPCEDCGRELTETRTVRLAPTQYPKLHWRKYCYTCKCVCVVGQDTWWEKPNALNADIRRTENLLKYFPKG